jgi:P-type Ca2+ transporter type 2C
MNQAGSEGHYDSAGVNQPKAWHGIEIAEVAQLLEVGQSTGLASQEAASRLAAIGMNRLAGQPPRSPWRLFLSQFKSVLILILVGPAVLAALIGNLKDASVILAVVVINAIVGFYQEHRAEQSLAALRKMLPLHTRVRRDGNKLDIDASALVPGDVVLLEAGDRVPADGRLVVAANLDIDESTLTGESHPANRPRRLQCSICPWLTG